MTPFVNALLENDLKVGLYYSLIDWTHEDYPRNTKNIWRYKIDEDPKRWDRFQKYNFGQMQELRDRYQPDLWWFDGDWEASAEEWRAAEIREMLLEYLESQDMAEAAHVLPNCSCLNTITTS